MSGAKLAKRGGGRRHGGGGNADVAVTTRASSSWNAQRLREGREQFAAAVAANPNHAESHFMLGMANLNLGKLPEAAKEFETYSKIAPTGPNAAKAKSNSRC